MLVHIKLLVRRGNRTFWHNRLVSFNGTSEKYGDNHYNIFVKIITRLGKKRKRVKYSTKPTIEIFGRITYAVKNGFFLGTEDYIGRAIYIENRIERRFKKIRKNIRRGRDNPLEDAHPLVPIPQFI